MPNNRYCESCGKPNREDARFCGHCGETLPELLEDIPEWIEEVERETQRNKSIERIALGVGVIMSLAVLGYFLKPQAFTSFNFLSKMLDGNTSLSSPNLFDSSPNLKKIMAASAQIARKTSVTCLSSGVIDVSLKNVHILGKSFEGDVVRIKTIVEVNHNGEGSCMLWSHGGGFGRWLTSSELNPNETMRLNVTFTYRKYDTGWLLEDYS